MIIYAADFETTVDEDTKNQESTEVWSAAIAEVGNIDNHHVFTSISKFMQYICRSTKESMKIYFHNLKFDGSFIIDWLLRSPKFKEAGYEKDGCYFWHDRKVMVANSYKYMISDRGQWYSITIRTGTHYIEIVDSLKLLPFSLKAIGKSFDTPHQKLTMEYKGNHYAGCKITDAEMEYILNDVFVLAEAIEHMQEMGSAKSTIGACCFSEYKTILFTNGCFMAENANEAFRELFPDLSEIPLDTKTFGESSADAYIRRSYRGGWCYLKKGMENHVYRCGCTADVNSLYPSQMHSESGRVYPIGYPTFWTGNFIPDEAKGDNKYYFIRIRCHFYIKKRHLPFMQIKGSWLYRGTEMLETSDIWDAVLEKYTNKFFISGKEYSTKQTITMTCVDFERFLEFYDTKELEILDGCWFFAEAGLFDTYINKYMEIKMNSVGALRTLAKLYLNNLYGKFATSDDSSFKVAFLDEEGNVKFKAFEEHEKQTQYIAVGSAITSHARDFTIRHAQMNYKNFIYADTDSLHMKCRADHVHALKIHPTAFNAWKLESYWDEAIFVRQKTYIEHITHEDEKKIDKAYYNVKCAGMPERCKELFVKSFTGDTSIAKNEEEKEFLKVKRDIHDLKIGLKVPSKLTPRRVKGGIVLTETEYTLRAK